LHLPLWRIIKRQKGREIMAEITLHIDGMHCGSCIRRVTQALASTEGVVVNEVRVGAARFSSEVEPAPVDLAVAALAKAGFTARLES
jgi:copper chaperone CopZ